MKHLLPHLLLSCLLAGRPAGLARGAEPSGEELARALLAKAGVKVGVCEMPRVGDGALAAGLAKAEVGQVHGLARDDAGVALARKVAEAAGVLGSQVIVEKGTPEALPLGDWVADLLVVTDASDENLKELPAGEIRRVVSPYRGVAIVGQAKGGKGGLTAPALEAWARGGGGTAEIKGDGLGLWAVVKMPALAGGDDWGHYYHGPDGNAVSRDTALKGPRFGLQWMGGPYWAGKFDVHVASAGRVFSAQSTIYWRNGALPHVLRARSLYNGAVLWERPVAVDFGDIGSLMVATVERLYLKDGGGGVVLKAETGEEMLRLGKKEDGDCKWLMLSDGVLVTLHGPKKKARWEWGKDTAGKTHEEQQDIENASFYAQEIVGWEAQSGEELWRFKEDRIDPAKVAIRDGRVYLYAKLSYAACLELKTGKPVWKTEAPVAEPRNPGMGLGWALNAIMTPRCS